MTYQLIIKNANYYAHHAFFSGDIIVENGKIAMITQDSSGWEAERVIDARGLTVLPGIIDSHVHFREPGRPDREDFYTGSCAAAAGGVTTFCEMPLACPPPNNPANLQQRIALGEEKSLVDFAMFGAAGYENTDQFSALLDLGAVAFKTFLHPAPAGREAEFDGLTVGDDGQLFLMLEQGAKSGGRFFFHCENASLIAALEQKLHAQGQEGNDFHYLSRPSIAEVESVEKILRFARATGCPVGIVHITVPEACELVKQAQAEGVDVIAETCFHYLVYNHRHIDAYGPYAKCNPPLRSEAEMERLWDYVKDGTIMMIGSDHAPFIPEEKSIGLDGGIWKAYSGMPAIEVLLPILLDQAHRGRLTLEQLVPLLTENTARAHGLFPRKGLIQVGADADFAIVDLQRSYTLRIADMYSKAKAINKLFDGTKVQGKPVYTIVRGRVLMQDGQVDLAARGYGRYVPAIR
ncbi:MAG: allantoinase AllB [Clostridia bacterium]|nr:allantoinase AllB [Clostridia bacterium]